MTRREDKELHEQTIGLYLLIQEACRMMASPDFPGEPMVVHQEKGLLNSKDGRGKEWATLLWSHLRTTNIFEFHPDILSVLTNAFIKQIAESNPEFILQLHDEKKLDYHDERLEPLIKQAASNSVMPANMPFDCVYLSYGSGATLNAKAHNIDPKALGNTRPSILAHLIVPNGDVWSLAGAIDPNPYVKQPLRFIPILERTEGRWFNPLSMAAFIVPWIISYINAHRAIVEDRTRSFSYRRGYKAAIKKYKHRAGPPPPYYVIPMDLDNVQVYRERRECSNTEIEWTCRRKRRGHERVKIRRGKLPLDPKTEAKIRREWERAKGEFELFTTRRESERAAEALARRGYWPKRPDEWLAVLYTWIDDVVWPKDRPDLPLVESVRRPKSQPRMRLVGT